MTNHYNTTKKHKKLLILCLFCVKVISTSFQIGGKPLFNANFILTNLSIFTPLFKLEQKKYIFYVRQFGVKG